MIDLLPSWPCILREDRSACPDVRWSVRCPAALARSDARPRHWSRSGDSPDRFESPASNRSDPWPNDRSGMDRHSTFWMKRLRGRRERSRCSLQTLFEVSEVESIVRFPLVDLSQIHSNPLELLLKERQVCLTAPKELDSLGVVAGFLSGKTCEEEETSFSPRSRPSATTNFAVPLRIRREDSCRSLSCYLHIPWRTPKMCSLLAGRREHSRCLGRSRRTWWCRSRRSPDVERESEGNSSTSDDVLRWILCPLDDLEQCKTRLRQGRTDRWRISSVVAGEWSDRDT